MAIWAEEIFFPKWALKRFEVFLEFLDGSSSNRKMNIGGQISSSSNVSGLGEGSTANLEIWKMKDWVQPLENHHGSTHTPLGED